MIYNNNKEIIYKIGNYYLFQRINSEENKEYFNWEKKF